MGAIAKPAAQPARPDGACACWSGALDPANLSGGHEAKSRAALGDTASGEQWVDDRVELCFAGVENLCRPDHLVRKFLQTAQWRRGIQARRPVESQEVRRERRKGLGQPGSAEQDYSR